MLIDARNYRSRILIFEANARSIRSRDDNSDDEFFEKYEDIINAGNNQTQREPRTIKQRRGTRGSGCCTLDLFKVLCKRNCREPLAIFSRDYVSNRIGSEVFGRKVKKKCNCIVIDYCWKWLCSTFHSHWIIHVYVSTEQGNRDASGGGTTRDTWSKGSSRVYVRIHIWWY